MNSRHITFPIMIVFCWTVCSSAAYAAGITSWSNSRTSDRTLMFQVKMGEKITFGVEAKGARNYHWTVNKKAIENNGKTLTWVVPKDGGIWEIHLEVSGTGDTGHIEWVVSTLNKNQAPDFYDSFTDRKYAGDRAKDPWGRMLPKWSIQNGRNEYMSFLTYGRPVPDHWWETPRNRTAKPVASSCYLEPPGGQFGGHVNSYLFAKHKAWFGTWKFRFRFPNAQRRLPGGWCHFCVIPTYGRGYFYLPIWYAISGDGHHYFRPGSTRWGMDYYSSFKLDKQWHQVTIIKTPDYYYYTYVDGILQFRRHNPMTQWDENQMWARLVRYNPAKYPGDTVCLDEFQIYKDRFLFPAKGVKVREYIRNWTYKNGKFSPLKVEGIVIEGRGVRLADVAKMVGNPQIFRYDHLAKTAVCRRDLVISPGCELIIKGETLNFVGPKAPLRLSVLYGGSIRIIKSKVAAKNGYFVWRFCNTANFGFPLSLVQKEQVLTPLSCASLSTVEIRDSRIENSAGFFLESPNELYLTNVIMLNMRAIDDGDYTCPKEFAPAKSYFKGPKSFQLALNNIYVKDMEISNVKFTFDDKPLRLVFSLNRQQEKWNLYDINAGGCEFVLKKGLGMDWKKQIEYYPADLGLVNCKFLKLAPEKGAKIIPKYYLDVRVSDAKGRPVSGANVTVENEVDFTGFPPENRERFKVELQEYPRPAKCKILRWYMSKSRTVTGPDGHTPPPDDLKGTLILSDYVVEGVDKKEFTYRITVEKDGLKKVITGVNPGPDWYRPDPKKPTCTITAVLGNGGQTP